jgi:ABC-type glutathione transport system ATPase component
MSDGVASRPAASPTLLEVRDLRVDLIADLIASPPVTRSILSEIAFDIEPGRIVGLFGESGCGKTTLALALLNLLPGSRYRVRGQVLLNRQDILTLTRRRLEQIRGAEISIVLQDPLLALNPVIRAGSQVAEVLRAHGVSSPGGVESLFSLAGLPDPGRIAAAYPHQLSGGERQRVAIAQALACRPALVIADEPFTALDPNRVVELAGLFRNLRDRLLTAFLLISHSPGVLAACADYVLVMHAGRIVERGTPQRVFASPSDPYTARLLQSVPRLRRFAREGSQEGPQGGADVC